MAQQCGFNLSPEPGEVQNTNPTPDLLLSKPQTAPLSSLTSQHLSLIYLLLKCVSSMAAAPAFRFI